MVEQLEQVNPGKMNHEQKVAFWINIYNALMMHVKADSTLLLDFNPCVTSLKFALVRLELPSRASCCRELAFATCVVAYLVLVHPWQAYLAYGIPRNRLKRLSLLQKVPITPSPRKFLTRSR